MILRTVDGGTVLTWLKKLHVGNPEANLHLRHCAGTQRVIQPNNGTKHNNAKGDHCIEGDSQEEYLCVCFNSNSNSNSNMTSKTKAASSSPSSPSSPAVPSVFSLSSIFWSKAAYRHVASEFHPYHQHDLNVAAHLFTTGLGVWGAIQLLAVVAAATSTTTSSLSFVYAYAVLIALTVPFTTAVLHTAFVYGCLRLQVANVVDVIVAAAAAAASDDNTNNNNTNTDVVLDIAGRTLSLPVEPLYICILAIIVGYGLQDLAHYIFQEKTYMESYMSAKKPWMLLVHSIWLMPLVMDAILMRYCFLPKIPSRNRNVFTTAASRQAVEELRRWINRNIPSTPETTHVWPHQQPGTDAPTTALEYDSAILEGFRKIFAAKHFDIKPVQDMNEIYVTAVGSKKEINSDAVFYTPHTDGPYWFLPGVSLYRVLVGLTPNTMVRTRFNLQHASQDKIVDMYDVLGFDYNRELHWIDHVPGKCNTERRSLLKLHFIVYPTGWHWYGALCAKLNTNYNTWARGNFLRTLRPAGMYEYVLAWWIWLTTWFNALWEEYFGWSNAVYLVACYSVAGGATTTTFLILTSFRHYIVYMTTLAFRQPMVGHGYLMRDAKLYKTIALMHLGRRFLPLVDMPKDAVAVLTVACGFGITIAATARLGMVRTYFGAELGFVKPRWITGFPYGGVIPHPMIVGQLIAFSAMLYNWWDRLTTETVALIVAHMTFYTVHMVQEMITSSYF